VKLSPPEGAAETAAAPAAGGGKGELIPGGAIGVGAGDIAADGPIPGGYKLAALPLVDFPTDLPAAAPATAPAGVLVAPPATAPAVPPRGAGGVRDTVELQ
ncbi:MAG: hypothetical protein ACKOU6_21065, partial [Planctomycetota bacterium]